MIRNKITYLYLISTIVLLLLNLFVLNIRGNINMAIMSFILFITGLALFGYNKDNFYLRKSVMFMMILVGLVQLALYYYSGVIFGFSENIIKASNYMLLRVIIPMAITIIFIELWRYMIVDRYNNTKLNFFCTIILVLVDINLFGTTYNLSYLSDVLELTGLVIFPSVLNNIVYNKITREYGYKPVMFYRLITVVGLYLIPLLPNMDIYLRSIIKMSIPILIYLIGSYMYDRTDFKEVMHKIKLFDVASILLLVFILALGCLVSCKFEYGLMTIGSGSMTGTIDKGDVVIFEKLGKNDVNIDDIVIYNNGKKNVVHRVVEKSLYNNKYVFATKGDVNESIDPGYIGTDNIIGIVKGKIKYIGFPSIWVKDLFEK